MKIQYKSGGDTRDGNRMMLKNQAVEFKHHATELSNAVKKAKHVDAWVVAKAERATTDLSDITHYLDGQSDNYAKGGVTYIDARVKDTDYYRKYYTRYPNAIGSFQWGTKEGSKSKYYNLAEGILYPLDEFDREYYAHLLRGLRKGEYLFRYRTDRMLKDEKRLIKINLDKSLVYFMDSENMDEHDDKNIKFLTRGVEATYIVVEYDKLFPAFRYEHGGETTDDLSLSELSDAQAIQMANAIISEEIGSDDSMQLTSGYAARRFLREYHSGAADVDENEIVDHFSNADGLPDEVVSVIERYSDIEHNRDTLSDMRNELMSTGYNFDYDDDMIPHSLRRIDEEEQDNGMFADGGMMADGGVVKRKTKKEKEEESRLRRMRKRYYVTIYHGGEMPKETKIFENLSDAREAAMSGEHSTILDLLTGEEVFANGGMMADGGEINSWIGSYKKPLKTSDVREFLNSTKNDGHKYSLWNKSVGVTFAYNGKLYANNGQVLPKGTVIDLDKVMNYWEKNNCDTLFVEDKELVILPELQDKYNCYTTGYDGRKNSYGNEDDLTLQEAVDFCWHYADVRRKYQTEEDLEKEIKSTPYGKNNIIASSGITGVVVYKLSTQQYADDKGSIESEQASIGDSALVVSENKLGTIVSIASGKYLLKFVDGTTKSYNASELKFIKDEDEYADEETSVEPETPSVPEYTQEKIREAIEALQLLAEMGDEEAQEAIDALELLLTDNETSDNSITTYSEDMPTDNEEDDFSITAYADDMDTIIGRFTSVNEAKQFAKDTISQYDEIVFEDNSGDTITVTQRDTAEDIDLLFSDNYQIAESNVPTSMQRLKSIIRDLARKSSGDEGNVLYMGSEPGQFYEIGGYEGLKPQSSQANSKKLEVNFYKDNTQYVFSNEWDELTENRLSYEKYRGNIFLFIPMTNAIAAEIISKYFSRYNYGKGGMLNKAGRKNSQFRWFGEIIKPLTKKEQALVDVNLKTSLSNLQSIMKNNMIVDENSSMKYALEDLIAAKKDTSLYPGIKYNLDEFHEKVATYLREEGKLIRESDDDYGKGGTTFQDKVNAISGRLEGTQVPRRLRSDYGRRYNKEEAKKAAQRIAGAMRKKGY